MSVSSINSSNMMIDATSSTVENNNSVLNSSDFLELLMVQYQNQDPLEPVSDTESLAQMAEFSSLDMMDKMMASQTTTQMYSLLGQEITYSVTDETTGQDFIYEGTVESVVTSGGKTQLYVGGHYIDLTQIQQVNATSTADETEAGDAS